MDARGNYSVCELGLKIEIETHKKWLSLRALWQFIGREPVEFYA